MTRPAHSAVLHVTIGGAPLPRDVAPLLVLAGGLLYTLGALVYALRRPDPRPAVFGFHEVFHVLVIAAVACQYAAVAFFVLPEH